MKIVTEFRFDRLSYLFRSVGLLALSLITASGSVFIGWVILGLIRNYMRESVITLSSAGLFAVYVFAGVITLCLFVRGMIIFFQEARVDWRKVFGA